jgi:hypothetical protein
VARPGLRRSGRLRPSTGRCRYRAVSRCGVLVYVGVTSNLLARIGGQAAWPINHRWALRVARWDWEVYPTRRAALEAEKHAIRTERPVYNRAHAVERKRGAYPLAPLCRCRPEFQGSER